MEMGRVIKTGGVCLLAGAVGATILIKTTGTEKVFHDALEAQVLSTATGSPFNPEGFQMARPVSSDGLTIALEWAMENAGANPERPDPTIQAITFCGALAANGSAIPESGRTILTAGPKLREKDPKSTNKKYNAASADCIANLTALMAAGKTIVVPVNYS